MSCAVPFADVLQYAGASSVEVTGGPKLLRHIKPGRCVQNIRTITLPLTQIPNHHPITTQSPPNHHPITTELPPNYHPITTEVPPNHHRITTESLTIETHPLRDRCDAKGPSEKFILPAATGQGVSDMVNTIPFFKKCHCAGPSHLVALTGAHTLGHAHSRYVPCFVPSKVPSKVPWYYSYPPKVPLHSFIQFKSIIPI